MSKCNAYISIPRHNGEMLAKPTVEQMNAMFYYVGNSRWFELFGTPERAAKSLSTMLRCELGIERVHCANCALHDACRIYDGDEGEMLEWLESELRDD